MKIKNLKINKETLSKILVGAIVVGGLGVAPIMYYTYENRKQICETTIDNNNIYIGQDGKYNCYFNVGEHIIRVSRNDAYYHKSEEIEGYIIKEVIINGWRDNNQIIYVNTEPVIAIATNNNSNNLEFNNFGKVVNKTIKK